MNKVTITGIYADGIPTDENALNRFWRVAWLIAWERVPIMTKFEELNDEAKRNLFDNAINEYLEYHENMSKHQTIAAFNAAIKAIAKLHRSFKSKLVNR